MLPETYDSGLTATLVSYSNANMLVQNMSETLWLTVYYSVCVHDILCFCMFTD